MSPSKGARSILLGGAMATMNRLDNQGRRLIFLLAQKYQHKVGSMVNSKTSNLEKFFKSPANTTTRERIFFNRLSFDLMIAAARVGYHLHIYEPNVDRDGFDIIVEDEDSTRQLQTKAVLRGVGTNLWDIKANLLRANAEDQDFYGIDPCLAGRGGGVVLIEIDGSTADGDVVYSYTDYDIITAIAEGYLHQVFPPKRRGPTPKPARQEANEVLSQVWNIDRNETISLSRRLFVRLTTTDQLLAIVGMNSSGMDFGRFAIKQALNNHIKVDEQGVLMPNSDLQQAGTLMYHVKALIQAQPDDTGLCGGSKFIAFRLRE
jgi:hypothetical protein|tara:strand:- start:132 stop:1085 length:954 start_codon:yes stop_codon:yes gene_type:complete